MLNVNFFLSTFLGGEDKDQYKNYGKTVRKMISDCLRKYKLHLVKLRQVQYGYLLLVLCEIMASFTLFIVHRERSS